MKHNIYKLSIAALASMALASCTMKSHEAPPLTGPAELGTSVTVLVTPDVLQLDGASQSVVSVTIRDENGQPMRNAQARAEILVNGMVVDFGSLSARSLVTGSDGKATLVYTAPAINTDSEAWVEIGITPATNNAVNSTVRTAAIRLVPTGIRVPPSDLVPAFTFSPTAPNQSQNVLFNAESSRGTIAQYRWDFGDGSTGTGRTATHAFSSAGTFFVRLTLVDDVGRTASTIQSVTVTASAAPTANFTFSPTDPQPGDLVNFNAASSTPGTGRRIVSYTWDFGDGGTASGAQVTRRYTVARTYTVTLTVTDDAGRTATTSKTIGVKVPEEEDGGTSSH